MNIKQKLAAWQASITLFSFGLILTVISYVIYENAKDEALDKISLIADKISLEVNAYLSGPLNEAYFLKQLVLDGNILNRTQVLQVLNVITASQDSILGSYVTFEPNAFDGKDNLYKNTQYHDKTGRFVPYSVKSKGKIIIEDVVGYDSPDLEVYHIPKQTKKTALIPPYDYPVDGVPVTMVSLAYPIIRDQKFLGISGVDISLDTIRQYLKNIYILQGKVKITFVASNDYILYDGFSSGNKETIWDHKKMKT